VMAMALYDESGVDGKNLTIYVKLNAVTGFHVAFGCEIGDELILEPANSDECGRIVWDEVLRVDCPLEYTAVLVDGVLRVGDDRDPLGSV